MNLVELIQAERIEIVGELQEYSYGKFAWIIYTDGQEVELWEPEQNL